MAGINTRIEVDDREVFRALNALLNAGDDLEGPFTAIGQYLAKVHTRRFADQVDPDGQRWAPLSDEYVKRKPRNKDMILVLNDHLADSFRYQESKDDVLVGTDRVYAATHHFGDPKRGIPARPFIGINDDDHAEIIAIINDHLGSSFEG